MFDGGIARMNFRADPPNATLARIIQKSFKKAPADALASPMRPNEEGDDIHGLTGKLCAPFVGGIGITAKCFCGIDGDQHNSMIMKLMPGTLLLP